MAKNISIVIGKHQTDFKLLSGDTKKSILLNALIQGEKSKRINDFDPKAHLLKLHKKYSRRN